MVYHPRLRLFLPRCLPRRCRRRRRRRRYSRGSPFQPRGRSRPRFYLAPCAATDRENNNVTRSLLVIVQEQRWGEKGEGRKNRERKKKRERRAKTWPAAGRSTPMILFKQTFIFFLLVLQDFSSSKNFRFLFLFRCFEI